jgi:hypothetical protein
VEQKDRESEIWKEVWDIQKEQMENFQTRKRETIERCRQIQIEAEASVLETQRIKKTERTELCEAEKRKIKRKYEEKVEVGYHDFYFSLNLEFCFCSYSH